MPAADEGVTVAPAAEQVLAEFEQQQLAAIQAAYDRAVHDGFVSGRHLTDNGIQQVMNKLQGFGGSVEFRTSRETSTVYTQSEGVIYREDRQYMEMTTPQPVSLQEVQATLRAANGSYSSVFYESTLPGYAIRHGWLAKL